MFNLQLRVFDEDEDVNPNWNLTDEEALVFLELVGVVKFNKSNYDSADEWNDLLPLGYHGYMVLDSETGTSWILHDKDVFLYNNSGVSSGKDPNRTLENFLIECVREPVLKALAKPTRPE